MCYDTLRKSYDTSGMCGICGTWLIAPRELSQNEIDIIVDTCTIFYEATSVGTDDVRKSIKKIFMKYPGLINHPCSFKYLLNTIRLEWINNLFDKITNVECCKILMEKNKDFYNTLSIVMQNNKELHKILFKSDIINTTIMEQWDINDILKINGHLIGKIEKIKDVSYENYITACTNDGAALQYAPDEYKNNKELVSIAVANSMFALDYASDSLRDSVDVVSIAVKHNFHALISASDRIKNDVDIITNLLAINYRIIAVIPQNIMKQIPQDTILAALGTSGP